MNELLITICLGWIVVSALIVWACCYIASISDERLGYK